MHDLAGAAVLTLVLAAVGGYLLGSIPFGLIAAKLGGAGDIRQIGSGNIGATNVLRTGRKDLALITLLGDGGKGAAAVLIAYFVTHNAMVIAIAGGAAFLGHLFPVWLKFKGGKGVATYFGVMIAACWPAGLIAGAIWLIMAFTLRYSSLAALFAVSFGPILVLHSPVAGGIEKAWLALFMALLVIIRHSANILRLLKGEEPKIGKNA